MTISLQSEKHWKVNQMCVFDSLRPTAQRHIESLVRRKKRSPNPSFYLEEIKRTMIYERQRVKSSKNDKKKNQDYKNKKYDDKKAKNLNLLNIEKDLSLPKSKKSNSKFKQKT